MIAVFGAYRKPFVFEPTRFSRNILAIPLRCLAFFFFQHRLLSLPRQLSASFRALVCTSLQRQTQPIQSRSVHKYKQKRKEASADQGFCHAFLVQDEPLGNLARHIFLVLTSFLGIFSLSKPKFNFLSFFLFETAK